MRRDLDGRAEPAFAGPLKILVAVAAPDEGSSSGAVLDQERELQNILDAVEPAALHENCEVRILEVGHPDVIGDAIGFDAYHALHLSCHGLPGGLELEDEEGRALRTTAADLLAPIRRAGRPLPLVLVNACHSGVAAGETASLAEALLRGGIPAAGQRSLRRRPGEILLDAARKTGEFSAKPRACRSPQGTGASAQRGGATGSVG